MRNIYIFFLILFCGCTNNIEHYSNGKIKHKDYTIKNNLNVREEYFESGKLHKKFVYDNDREIYYLRFDENGKIKGSRLSIKIEPTEKKLIDSIELKIYPEYSDYRGFMLHVGQLDSNNFLKDKKAEYYLNSDTSFLFHKIKINKFGPTIFSGILGESSLEGTGDTMWISDKGSYYFKYVYKGEK